MATRRARPSSTNPAAPTALLLDFDGTLCPVDITAEMSRALGRPGWQEELLAMRASGAGSRRAQERLLLYLPKDLDTLLEFALAHELDAAARPLTEAAGAAGWIVEITSDGFGFYVRRMLARAGIRAAVRCADLAPDGDDLRLVAPWASRGGDRCPDCTTCKLDAVADLHDAGRRVILVGDGRSDRIAAEDADVVYATNMLAEHCATAGIPFRPWHCLADVLADLRQRSELPPEATDDEAAGSNMPTRARPSAPPPRRRPPYRFSWRGR
jgi:2-hydroxy-3-keto-5-methylthiopentenyl-1-phosphate phosphatase